MGAGCTTTQSQTITLSNVPQKAVIKETQTKVVEQDGQVKPKAVKQANEEPNLKMQVKIHEGDLE